MRESEIEAYLVASVLLLGGETRKAQWVGRRGCPDRRVMLPGRCFWAELKAPGERPEPHQAREHARMRAAGERVEVIDSKEKINELLGLSNGRV